MPAWRLRNASEEIWAKQNAFFLLREMPESGRKSTNVALVLVFFSLLQLWHATGARTWQHGILWIATHTRVSAVGFSRPWDPAASPTFRAACWVQWAYGTAALLLSSGVPSPFCQRSTAFGLARTHLCCPALLTFPLELCAFGGFVPVALTRRRERVK